jgi:signal transduction histidine kinase
MTIDPPVLILAPIGQDAKLSMQVLAEAGITGVIVKSINELCEKMQQPTACILLTEESITRESSGWLKEVLNSQETWSDLPIILMTSQRERYFTTQHILEIFSGIGNISLLERPVRTVTLVAAISVALRARHRQYQVRELLVDQQTALRQRDDFLSMASHELKTPLTSLKLQAQMRKRAIERGDASVYSHEKVDSLIHSTEKQVDRLSHLVDEMLDITRIRNGKLSIHPERVDLNVLAREVFDSFATQFQGVGSRLELSPAALFGFWDRFRLEQVITNLFTNALKYGGGQPIEIKTYAKADYAYFEVKDHGIGIDSEHHSRIFYRFERVAESRNIGGLGLGLYITRQIVESHHGTIRVESELGRGSRFIVKLPLKEKVYDHF